MTTIILEPATPASNGTGPHPSPPILAVANQKGGVGKTTTVAALGAAAADSGLRVLLVDWDPQASLTSALGAQPTPGAYAAVKA
jgi:chromosome partitioning protein